MELIAPMLAEAPADSLKRLQSDDWWMEQKLDGVRLTVHVDNGIAVPVNRKGQPIDMPAPLIAPFDSFRGQPIEMVFDGEFINGVFWLFDLPRAGQAVTLAHPFEHRRAVLEPFYEQWSPGPNVRLIHTARTLDEKADLLKTLRANRAEGAMFKRASGKYAPGRRSMDVQKLKFWKTCEVILTEFGREGKDNAVMSMIDPDHGVVEVGTISRIGKGRLELGDVVEVKFLYSVDPSRPRLYQPTIMRKRTDKDRSECTIDQLSDCFTNKGVVEVGQKSR